MVILSTAVCSAGNITRQDILSTIEHERRIVAQSQHDAVEAKHQLVVLQGTLDKQTAELSKAKADLDAANKSRDYWKRVAERLLFALSLAAGILAGLAFFQFAMDFIARVYPPALPFSVLISVGVGVVTFGSTWAALAHL